MNDSDVNSYRDLRVWKRGMSLVSDVYRLTSAFPDSELYGLTSQLRRAAVSIPANIAEGWGQKTIRHYVHHLRIARSSVFEVETHVLISVRLGYTDSGDGKQIMQSTDIESRMLMSLILSLES